jgi:hypothetical protein
MDTFAIFLSILGGGSAVVNGLLAYLGKLRLERYKSELEATNKRLSLLMDKELHISKTQFDKEFTIYQDVWSKLVVLKAATISLRPELDIVDRKESDEDRKKRRLGLFSDALIAFQGSMEMNRPFFAESVYAKMTEIMRVCHLEGMQYSRQNDFRDLKSWDKAEKNRDAIIDGIENCCTMIRNRIHSVEVSADA